MIFNRNESVKKQLKTSSFFGKISLFFAMVLAGKYLDKGEGYGFIEEKSLPVGEYEEAVISKAGSMDWLITYDVKDLANNHCGAVAAVNIVTYYSNIYGYNELVFEDKRSTFKALHKVIKNGPVLRLAGKIRRYVKSRGFTLEYRELGSFDEIKLAVKNDKISAILLKKHLLEWHWVLGVGYREYKAGDKYIKLMNGWDKRINFYYKLNSGSAFMAATEYGVD